MKSTSPDSLEFSASERASAAPESTLDLCLVQMPYSTIQVPSLGLGLLKRYALDRGLRAKVFYGDLLWADKVGLDVYLTVLKTPVGDLLGEWVFSEAAFPGFEPDHESFLELIAPTIRSTLFEGLGRVHPRMEVKRLLFLLRETAIAFVGQMADDIIATGAKVVGCSSVFQQHCASLALLRSIKSKAPEIVTVLGGANCEGEMGITNHRLCPWLDIVVSGEADAFFGDLCTLLVEKGPDLEPEELPYGVLAPCHRRMHGDESYGFPEAPRAMVKDLDTLAVPDFDDYFETLAPMVFAPFVGSAILIETSRGCWWGEKRHCTFCGLNGAGMAYRSKSAERAVSEIQSQVERYGIRRLECVDNILDMRYFKTVLPELEAAREQPHIFYEVKPNLRRDQLESLSRAGIRWLQPGIESLDDRVLDLLEKGGTGIRNIQLLKWARELGTRLSWGYLSGAPNEEDSWYEEMVEWLPWLCHLQPPMGMARIRYDRFSPYHMQQERFGIELSPLKTYSYVFPFPEEELAKLSYFFEDYSDLSRGDIDALRPGEKRPGLEAVGVALREWKDLFEGDTGSPILTKTDDGSELIIRDTRPMAKAEVQRFEGLHRSVYLAADRGLPPEALLRQVQKDSGGNDSDRQLEWADIEPVLDDLVGRCLVLPIFDRYLALAVAEPMGSYPVLEETPDGFVKINAAFRSLAPISLAKAARDTSKDIPKHLMYLFS